MAPRWLAVAGATALVVGIAALSAPSGRPYADALSWESLLAPYSQGVSLPHGFRIDRIHRGSENDVVIQVSRPADGAAVEVHVLQRGRWTGVNESQSFAIAYETLRSPAAEREAITAVLADTIRSRDHGLPAPGAIPLGASPDVSVVPWWLETLRGGRGVLLGASVVLLALIVLVRSAGLTVAGLALGGIDLVARATGVASISHDIGAGWLTLAAALLLVAAVRRGPFPPRADRLVALGVTVGALCLRLGLGSWGPLHVNGHAGRFVAGAARDPGDIAAYGPGYAEVFQPIAALAPSSPDWAIFACNALLSSLAAPLAFALARMTGVPRAGAIAAALLLAIDPIAIRMGATESYFPAITFFCMGAATSLLVALRELQTGRRWGAAAAAAAAGLLVAQAARIHPAAWTLAATVPFVVLAGEAATLPQRMLVFVASAAICAGLVVAISGGALLDVLGNILGGTVLRPLPPSPWPLIWIAVAAAAYALIAPRRWLALPAAISVGAMLMTEHAYGASWIWQQSYYRLYLALPLIALIAAVPAGVLHRSWIVAAAVVLVILAWWRFGLPIIAARTTDHFEYRWMRERLAALPAECRVIYVASAGTRVLLLPTYTGPPSREAVAIDPLRPHAIEAGLSPARCAYYVRSSLCSSADGRPLCEAIENRLTLVPIARASFAAIPSSIYLSYDRDPVETIIARVEGIAPAAPIRARPPNASPYDQAGQAPMR